MRHLSISAVAALALLSAAPAAAQTIRGRVLDDATGQPVDAATVSALAENGRAAGRARTDATGAFVLELREPGMYRVSAERVGYRTTASAPLDLGMRVTVEVDVRLSTTAVPLTPLTVTARREPPRVERLARSGFYDRERAGLGKFIVRDDIEAAASPRLSDVLKRKVAGVRTIPGRWSGQHLVFARAISSGGTCFPRIYVDGQPYSLAPGEVFDNAVPADAVEAVEVYRGPSQTPAQFGGAMSACGVVVVWTRSGLEHRPQQAQGQAGSQGGQQPQQQGRSPQE